MSEPPTTVVYQLAPYYRWPVPEELVSQVALVEATTGEPLPEGLTGDVLVTDVRCADMVEVAAATGVRWVHLVSSGLDGVDVAGLRRLGAVVTNSAGASAVPISEWVLAMMLAFEKRLPDTWIDQPPERWHRPAENLGTLRGRRLGLVGYGAIGKEVARLAVAFGMEVRVLRRTGRPAEGPSITVVGSPAEAFADAHHVVLAAPLTPETEGIFGSAALDQVDRGVHLVNIARGGLVDQDALRTGLDDGRVAAASLDTMTPEPLPAGHWLYGHPKVRLSPHVSANWPHMLDALHAIFWENVRRHRAGTPLANVVAEG